MDDLGAFVAGARCQVPGTPGGALDGLTFAVKDLIDVAGWPTGGGNPDWPREHPTPTRHAWVVQALLDAGASVIGKTVTDEVSLGILGENAHDGTPINPAAPGRVPGGSSSGSASAVAGGLCDFALGTDSGGSVRVPASFCGLHGIRPTHGHIDFTGITVQSPGADTCGWFARDAATFARVGAALCGAPLPTRLPTTLLVAEDAFGFADSAVQDALAPLVDRLAAVIGQHRTETLAPQGLSTWQRSQRVLQGSESWRTFEPWLDRCNPRPGVQRGAQPGARLDADRRRAHRRGADARGGARPPAPVAAAGHDPVPADNAFPCPGSGAAPLGACLPARADKLPDQPRRPDRRAAGQPARRHRGRRAGRPVHRRRTRGRP